MARPAIVLLLAVALPCVSYALLACTTPRSTVDIAVYAGESCPSSQPCNAGDPPRPPEVWITPPGAKTSELWEGGIPFIRGEAKVSVTLRDSNPFCFSHSVTMPATAYTPSVQGIMTFGGSGAAKPAAAGTAALMSTEAPVLPPPGAEVIRAFIEGDLDRLELAANLKLVAVDRMWSFCTSTRQENLRNQLEIAEFLDGCATKAAHKGADGSVGCSGEGELARLQEDASEEIAGLSAMVGPMGSGGPGSTVTPATVAKFTQRLTDVTASLSSLEPTIALVRSIIPPARRALTDGGDQRPGQWFDANQTVTATVSQTPLQNGASPASSSGGKSNSGAPTTGGAQTPATPGLGTVTLHTQSPVYVSVGIGPAYIFENTKAWSVVGAPGAPTGSPGVVTRVTDQANLDAMISISPYWSGRYLSDALRFVPAGPVECKDIVLRFLPRPVLGLSAKAPISAVYVGAQWDPFQFIDVSAGAYFYSRPELLSGVSESQTIAGTSVPTRNVTGVSGFVAVTSSVSLFTSWLSTTVKGP